MKTEEAITVTITPEHLLALAQLASRELQKVIKLFQMTPEPEIDYKEMFEQMCVRCDALDKALGGYERAQALAAQPADKQLQYKELFEQMCERSDAQDKTLANYEKTPENQMLHGQNVAFNSAIDFAIEQGSQAAVFLRSWREGDTSEWPEFSATTESQT
jgi:hypothetical protein